MLGLAQYAKEKNLQAANRRFKGVCYMILPDESYAIAFQIVDFLRNNGTKLT